MTTLESISTQHRLEAQVHLVPANDSMLQPPTFSGMNAALYTDPRSGSDILLLDTEQSAANRLECSIVKNPEFPEPADALMTELKGLPYMISLLPDGESYAISLLESHRMGDAYFGCYGTTAYIKKREKVTQKIAKELEEESKKSKGKAKTDADAGKTTEELLAELVQSAMDQKTPLPAIREGHKSFLAFWQDFLSKTEYSVAKPMDYHRVCSEIFRYDPNSLLHGVWLAGLNGGRIRIPRAMSVEIRALGAKAVELGGVKADRCNTANNVPYPRTRYVAEDVIAYAMIDLDQIRGYGLPAVAGDLLLNLALLKLSRFFCRGLRLRTDCTLDLLDSDVKFTRPKGIPLEGEKVLAENMRTLIRQCTEGHLFATPAVTRLVAPLDVNVKKDDEDASPADAKEDEEGPNAETDAV